MVRASTAESNPDGGGMLEAGAYHFVINEAVARDYQGRVSVEVELQVLNGTNAAMIHHKHREFFGLDGKSVNRWFELACAVGLLTREQWQASKEAGVEIDVDETAMTGMSFCGEIRMEEYKGQKAENQGKSFPQLGFRIWSPLDPKAAHIPKDQNVMAMLTGKAAQGQASPPASATGNGAHPESPKQPDAPAGDTQAGDQWGDVA